MYEKTNDNFILCHRNQVIHFKIAPNTALFIDIFIKLNSKHGTNYECIICIDFNAFSLKVLRNQ